MSKFRTFGIVASIFVSFCALAPNYSNAKPANMTVSKTSPIEIEWRLSEYYLYKENSNSRTKSEFILTNPTKNNINLSNIAIYFNCLSGAQTFDGGNAIIEHLNGTYYRLLPTNKSIILAPNQSISLIMDHDEAIQTISKAPIGAYLVNLDKAETPLAFSKFIRSPLPRGNKMKGTDDGFSTLLSPAEIFEQNSKIQPLQTKDLPPIYPLPLHYEYFENQLKITSIPKTTFGAGTENFEKFTKSLFSKLPKTKAKSNIILNLSINEIPNTTSKEAYQILVKDNQINIIGASQTGVFYGLQSFKQMLDAGYSKLGINLRETEIIDAPRFEYRGLLIDSARNFKTKEKILETLELMASLKLNKLHFHLTDDEAWRIEIKAIPELTKFGAVRGHDPSGLKNLPPAYGSGPFTSGKNGSGYYSRGDYIEILKKAASLNIEIIPEVEMPGHARAAVKAMESRFFSLKDKDPIAADKYRLADPLDVSKYRSAQLYNDNVINPALDSTYAFMETVISEIADMHKAAGVPLKRIQLGADELGNGAWEGSPKVAQLMAKLNTSQTADVWDYFYNRLDAISGKYGVKIGGWEELGMRKLPKGSNPSIIPNAKFADRDFLLFIWNNLEGSEDWANQLANLGYDVILAPVTNLYFDMMHNKDSMEPGHNWSRHIDMREVFEFDPFNMTKDIPNSQNLRIDAQKNVKGIEATMFSETMVSEELHDYMLYPRIFGLAERAWSKAPDWQKSGGDNAADWSRFMNQLSQQFLPNMDASAPFIKYRIPPVGIKTIDGKVFANHQFQGIEIRYTTDGTTPTKKSKLYVGPLENKGQIKFAPFTKSGRMGPVNDIINK